MYDVLTTIHHLNSKLRLTRLLRRRSGLLGALGFGLLLVVASAPQGWAAGAVNVLTAQNDLARTACTYVFAPGNLVASSASLDASGTNVTLAVVSTLPQNMPIMLAIDNVESLNGNSVSPGTSITSFSVNGQKVSVNNGAVNPPAFRFTGINLVSGQVVLQWLGSGTWRRLLP